MFLGCTEKVSSPKMMTNILFLPSFDFGEIKGHLSVGDRLLVQVATVPPDERGHVVA